MEWGNGVVLMGGWGDLVRVRHRNTYIVTRQQTYFKKPAIQYLHTQRHICDIHRGIFRLT